METAVNLIWHGSETVAVARAAVNDHRDVELQLPAGLHHAVATHFRSGAPGRDATVDIDGGPELLEQVASIDGLQLLRELRGPAVREHAHVRIVSPSPKILISAERTAS